MIFQLPACHFFVTKKKEMPQQGQRGVCVISNQSHAHSSYAALYMRMCVSVCVCVTMCVCVCVLRFAAHTKCKLTMIARDFLVVLTNCPLSLLSLLQEMLLNIVLPFKMVTLSIIFEWVAVNVWAWMYTFMDDCGLLFLRYVVSHFAQQHQFLMASLKYSKKQNTKKKQTCTYECEYENEYKYECEYEYLYS